MQTDEDEQKAPIENGEEQIQTIVQFNEKEYLEERKNTFPIEFKKEPLKSATQCFEVSEIY